MLNITRYNYPSITTNLIRRVVKDVDKLYEDKIIKPHAVTQTLDIIFNEKSLHWNKDWKVLRDTFLNSINQHHGTNFNNYKAWVYASFPGTSVVGSLWHTHPHSRFSGVMYLTLPKDIYDQVCYTTEFMEKDNRVTMLEPVLGSWFVFDSRYLHRPGFWDYENMKSTRYCLAASVW
jgi:hypothetical protein